jgi:hypothetical protein
VRLPPSAWFDWFQAAGLKVAESEFYVEEDGVRRSGGGDSGVLCVELVPDG